MLFRSGERDELARLHAEGDVRESLHPAVLEALPDMVDDDLGAAHACGVTWYFSVVVLPPALIWKRSVSGMPSELRGQMM